MALIGTHCTEDVRNDIFAESRKGVSEVPLRVISKLLVIFSIFMTLKLLIFHLVRFPKNNLTFET